MQVLQHCLNCMMPLMPFLGEIKSKCPCLQSLVFLFTAGLEMKNINYEVLFKNSVSDSSATLAV